MSNFFSLDNILFRFMGKLSDLIILNFLFLIFSLPIFTIGASFKSLYKVSVDLSNECEGNIVKDFFESFKENFKSTTFTWLMIVFLSVLIFLNFSFWPRFNGITSYIPLIFISFFTIIFLLTVPYLYPTMTKYNKGIFSNIKLSVLLSLKFLPLSILILLCGLFLVVINLYIPFTIFFTIFIGISLFTYLSSFIFNIIFNKNNLV